MYLLMNVLDYERLFAEEIPANATLKADAGKI